MLQVWNVREARPLVCLEPCTEAGHPAIFSHVLHACFSEPTETQRMRCTHCPLVFHVDCLKEPVTAVVVKGAWMCPNHPERIQSRRKIARLSLREPVEADEELDGEEVAATFIAKVAMERDAMPAGPAVPAVVPEADKRTFAEAMVRMHEDWWSQERVHLAGTGTSSCERSAPDMPVSSSSDCVDACYCIGV